MAASAITVAEFGIETDEQHLYMPMERTGACKFRCQSMRTARSAIGAMAARSTCRKSRTQVTHRKPKPAQSNGISGGKLACPEGFEPPTVGLEGLAFGRRRGWKPLAFNPTETRV